MFNFINLKDRDAEWFQNQEKKHLYLSKNWLESLSSSYNFEVLLVVNLNDKYQTAFCKLDDMMGKRLISLPFSDYIPFDKTDSSYYNELFKSCSSQFPQYEIVLKTNLNENILVDSFNLIKKAVYHSIELTNGIPKKSSSFKRGVKQAQKHGIVVRKTATEEAIKTFYQLYHRLRFDKFNIIPQPYSFFEKLWETMICQEEGDIFEAVLNNKVIASMIVLNNDGTAYYKYGCSDIEHLQLKPNNILFNELINHYHSIGYSNIDLGLSGIGDSYEGLRRWKKGLGGEEKPLTFWSLAPSTCEIDHKQISKNKELIRNLTGAIVKANLNSEQTSLLSEQIYGLLA